MDTSLDLDRSQLLELTAQKGITIAIVGVSDGLGPGKMTYDYFLPPFEQALATLGIEVQHYAYREFIRAGQQHDAAILLYGEAYPQ